MEKSIFEVPVRVSGRVVYHITSESESKAAEIAIGRAENADLGPLEDIDMEAMPAVTVRPAPEIQRQDRPEISALMTLSTGHVSLETFEQLMNEPEDTLSSGTRWTTTVTSCVWTATVRSWQD